MRRIRLVNVSVGASIDSPERIKRLEKHSESSKRLYLRLTVKLMLCISVCAVLWVFVQATDERHTVQKIAPSIAFDITDMQPGDVKTELWVNKPLVIVYRLPEWQSKLSGLSADLFHDPTSQSSVQPAEATNEYRSPEADWFVAVGLGTALGCPLRFAGPSADRYFGIAWPGGFIDTCDSTRYDLAGRVFHRQSAKKILWYPSGVWSTVKLSSKANLKRAFELCGDSTRVYL